MDIAKENRMKKEVLQLADLCFCFGNNVEVPGKVSLKKFI